MNTISTLVVVRNRAWLSLGFASAIAAALVPAHAGSVNLTVSIDASKQGAAYASNFTGLSFESGEMKPNNGTTGFMLDTNTTQSPKCNEVIKLVENMGLKHLRIGGGTVDTLTYGTDYTSTGIDALFNFAQTTGLKVIYSARLLGSSTYDPQSDSVAAASYVWNHYQTSLDYFAIGNEPNYHSYHTVDPEIFETTSGQAGTAYPSYAHNANGEWKEFAAAITAAVTGTPSFGGPDTGDTGTSTTTWWNNGTKNISWTQAFVEDRKSGNIAVPVIAGLTHYYVGPSSEPSQLAATTDMLSKTWVTSNYPTEYNLITGPVAADGWHYRFTECNDFLGSVSTASTTFASALWALDFMQWQAAHDSHVMGVDFHNKMSTYTGTLYQDVNGDYHSYPKSAAIKMFELGGQGKLMTSVSVSNPSAANVDCYAVGSSTDLYVTIINKTSQYVGDWTAASTTVVPSKFTVAHAYYIEMDSSPTTHDVTATDATVGGSAVNNNSGTWSGAWSTLTVSSNQCTVSVPSASAGIVHLTTY
jgi:hypothetical protein